MSRSSFQPAPVRRRTTSADGTSTCGTRHRATEGSAAQRRTGDASRQRLPPRPRTAERRAGCRRAAVRSGAPAPRRQPGGPRRRQVNGAHIVDGQPPLSSRRRGRWSGAVGRRRMAAPAIATPDTRARRRRGRRAYRSVGARRAARAEGARRATSSRLSGRSKSASVKTATRIARPPHVETEFAQPLGETAREVACWGGRRGGMADSPAIARWAARAFGTCSVRLCAHGQVPPQGRPPADGR